MSIVFSNSVSCLTKGTRGPGPGPPTLTRASNVHSIRLQYTYNVISILCIDRKQYSGLHKQHIFNLLQ